jgi:HEAT repeat protein
MLDLVELRRHVQTLDRGDDNARRQALHSLAAHGEQEWATAPAEAVHSLVRSLQQLLDGGKHTFHRQGVVAILGKVGRRSEPAIPQLVGLLREGNPDGLREAAVIALGKIGPEARGAVGDLLGVLADCRATLAGHAIRALADIGRADRRVRSALGNLWVSGAQTAKAQVQVAFGLCKLGMRAEGLVRFLTSTLGASPDSSFRRLAAEALAWCSKNEPDVVPSLLAAALNDKDEAVRQTAQESLAHLGLSHEQAARLCAKQLKDSAQAEAALRICGPLAVPAVLAALGAGDSATREKAARILGCLGESAAGASAGLAAALADGDVNVRLAAAKGLWNVTKNAAAVVPVFVELLEERGAATPGAVEPRRRFLQTVIEALWRIGTPAQAAVPVLLVKVKDKNRLISESALSALRKIAPTAAAQQASA